MIVLYSRDNKDVGMVHEKTSPKKPASISPGDDEAVLVRPKQVFRLTRKAFNKLLQNLKNIYFMEFSTD